MQRLVAQQHPILVAIFESGGTEQEQASALMLALQDISPYSLFKSVLSDLNSSSDKTLILLPFPRFPTHQPATASLHSVLQLESLGEDDDVLLLPRSPTQQPATARLDSVLQLESAIK
jgi:hypothetical protein